MKKLIDVLNPFVLLLVPVIVAMVLGISYQVHHEHDAVASSIETTQQAVPLFYKGVQFVKALCAVTQQNVW